MDAATAGTVRLEDYRPPRFLIPEVELDIDLVAEDEARVRAQLAVKRNPAATDPAAALKLDLDELSVESVAVDGAALTPQRYTLDERQLVLSDVPEAFTLTTVSRIDPARNTKLMGVYTSSTGFFSLCEAEGFRRITPFLDRPDVMARYTVTLHADKSRYPVLLANGNLVAHFLGQSPPAAGEIQADRASDRRHRRRPAHPPGQRSSPQGALRYPRQHSRPR